ncbi:MAG: hypothetical protein ACRD0G_16730 [Acidimicrobiales bacterium]
MHPDHAALEAIGAGLDQLLQRVTALAERHEIDPDERVAADLYELERSLTSARRLLDRVIRGR